jgi:hypothetical protein
MKPVEYLERILRFVLAAMRRLAAVWSVLVLCAAVQGADQPIDYATQIKPILVAKCFACHGALKEESGPRASTRRLPVYPRRWAHATECREKPPSSPLASVGGGVFCPPSLRFCTATPASVTPVSWKGAGHAGHAGRTGRTGRTGNQT